MTLLFLSSLRLNFTLALSPSISLSSNIKLIEQYDAQRWGIEEPSQHSLLPELFSANTLSIRTLISLEG